MRHLLALGGVLRDAQTAQRVRVSACDGGHRDGALRVEGRHCGLESGGLLLERVEVRLLLLLLRRLDAGHALELLVHQTLLRFGLGTGRRRMGVERGSGGTGRGSRGRAVKKGGHKKRGL
jgi:hypothetical protein